MCNGKAHKFAVKESGAQCALKHAYCPIWCKGWRKPLYCDAPAYPVGYLTQPTRQRAKSIARYYKELT